MARIIFIDNVQLRQQLHEIFIEHAMFFFYTLVEYLLID